MRNLNKGMEHTMSMAVKALCDGLMYEVKGRVLRTEAGQVFDTSPWDAFHLGRLMGQGFVEELAQLETAAPKVEEVAVEEEVVVDDLSMLSTKELRALCKERDLDSSGKKSALIARLESDE